MNHQLIALSDIELDHSLCVRPVRADVVRDYRQHLDELPPILLGRLGTVLLLLDGWHRYAAHSAAGAPAIKAETREVESRDAARVIVAGCDVRVGLRRSRSAKRRAVALLLESADAAGWSNRELARHTGTSHTLVAEVRAAHAASPAASRGGADGKIATPRARRGRPAPPLVAENDVADELDFLAGSASVTSVIREIERLLSAVDAPEQRRSVLEDLSSWVAGAMAEEGGADWGPAFEDMDEVG
jgi:CTP:molybdopterin cytidylyltransferase MocA